MNIDLLFATYSFVFTKKEAFVKEFYAQLFLRSPEIHQLFLDRHTDMQEQQNVFAKTFTAIITGLKDQPEQTVKLLSELGKRHQLYFVTEQMYDIAGVVLLDTLKKFLKDVWTPEKEATWIETYTLIKLIMLDAYEVQSDH